MKPAPIPENDRVRLRALEDYSVLDTLPESQFDAITRLASIVLDVPIALVTLIDADRQWFKSRHGLDAPETPRDVSFCGHAVAQEALLVVHDAILDARFADNPLVTGEPRVRFYAGFPLRNPEGFILGTLCAIDHVPRQPTPIQLEALQLLADQVMALLELRRVGRQLRHEQRALAEQQALLADRERRLQSLFEGMVEGVVLRDASGVVVVHNAAAESILGLSDGQLAGRDALDPSWRVTRADGSPFPDDDQPSRLTLRTGIPQADITMVLHDGSAMPRWLSVNSRPLIQPGEATPYAVITTFRDTTAERTIADRLARHQRLVTTGTLAAGVGHEINNPLTYMLTNLAMAIEELELLGGATPSPRIAEIVGLLDQVRDGGERVKRIVRGLKALARDDAQAVPSDLRPIIDSALSIAHHELRTRASVILELASVPPVRVDEARLTQVLVNLLVNAAQAFPASEPQANHIVIRTSASGTSVSIEVIDNGPGIAPDVLPRIFDPFFTTKPVGTGTGLGLSISHEIVTAFGGTLDCDTRPGLGTTFRITLPAVFEAPTPSTAPRQTRGRVLIVDDEPTILRSMARLLGTELEVVTTEDPREALQRIAAGEDFDVVFTDISMPHLTGMELYERVAALRPDLARRFVFVSGDLTRDDISRFLSRVPNERLEKPFTVQNLRRVARHYSGRDDRDPER